MEFLFLLFASAILTIPPIFFNNKLSTIGWFIYGVIVGSLTTTVMNIIADKF